MTAEAIRAVLAARLPADDPKWAEWIDGTTAELVRVLADESWGES